MTTTATASQFLRSMTDTQLIRLWNRILRRVTRDMFGADERTLYAVNPGLHHAFVTVRMEGRRRKL